MARYAYANTPDKKVEANVNALSACVSSPYRGGPAGCASTLSFEIRSPAPRSSFFFLLTDAGTGVLVFDWPAAAPVDSLAGGLGAVDLIAGVGFFVAGGMLNSSKNTQTFKCPNGKHKASQPSPQ